MVAMEQIVKVERLSRLLQGPPLRAVYCPTRSPKSLCSTGARSHRASPADVDKPRRRLPPRDRRLCVPRPVPRRSSTCRPLSVDCRPKRARPPSGQESGTLANFWLRVPYSPKASKTGAWDQLCRVRLLLGSSSVRRGPGRYVQLTLVGTAQESDPAETLSTRSRPRRLGALLALGFGLSRHRPFHALRRLDVLEFARVTTTPTPLSPRRGSHGY